STTSGKSPTTNGFSAVAPSVSYSRIHKTPGAASAGIVTDSLPFSSAAATVIPGRSPHARTGHFSKVPVAETETVVPRAPPAGNRKSIFGGAAPADLVESANEPRHVISLTTLFTDDTRQRLSRK